MLSLLRDLRLGVRALAKRPGSAAATVLALGIGIGLCTLLSSVIYGVFFRGLDVDEADRLLMIVRSDHSRGYPELWVQQHDFYDWREQQRSFEGLAGNYFATVKQSGPEGPALRWRFRQRERFRHPARAPDPGSLVPRGR